MKIYTLAEVKHRIEKERQLLPQSGILPDDSAWSELLDIGLKSQPDELTSALQDWTFANAARPQCMNTPQEILAIVNDKWMLTNAPDYIRTL